MITIKKMKIAIVINDGMVQTIYTTYPTDEIILIDFDTQDEDEYKEAMNAVNDLESCAAEGILFKAE